MERKVDLSPQILKGAFIDLEPLAEGHREGLRAAAAMDPSIFLYIPGDVGGQFDRWFDWSLGLAGGRTDRVFVVRDQASGEVAGSSRYLNISEAEPRLEIGFTWYRPSSQGTYVNPEAKLLLMRHAFEALGCIRVELKADAQNKRSRAAMEKMGAKFEGTLRRHTRVRPDYVRDTVYYSVLDREWPEVKAGLEQRINAFKDATA